MRGAPVLQVHVPAEKVSVDVGHLAPASLAPVLLNAIAKIM